MITAGIDLGVRKVALSICSDGVVTVADDYEVTNLIHRQDQLALLAAWVMQYVRPCEYVFIEEPLVGRGVRTSMQISQTCGAILGALGRHKTVQAQLVDNKMWKKSIVGSGNASKNDIKNWLKTQHPTYYSQCGENQDRIDACCIGLYGCELLTRAESLAKL